MSKGFITDASGSEVSFRNSIIVMTLNFNPETSHSQLGFENNTVDEKDSERGGNDPSLQKEIWG